MVAWGFRAPRNRSSDGCPRQDESEDALAGLTPVGQIPVHEPGELTGDGEPKTHRCGQAGSVVRSPVWLEDVLPVPWRHAGPVVGDHHLCSRIIAADGDADSIPSISQSIGDEVAKDLAYPSGVAGGVGGGPGEHDVPNSLMPKAFQHLCRLRPEVHPNVCNRQG